MNVYWNLCRSMKADSTDFEIHGGVRKLAQNGSQLEEPRLIGYPASLAYFHVSVSCLSHYGVLAQDTTHQRMNFYLSFDLQACLVLSILL